MGFSHSYSPPGVGRMSYLVFLLTVFLAATSGYHAGVGIGDITGPAAEVVMFGFGKPEHELEGIHTRMFARAFVVVDKPTGQVITNSDPRVVYVVADALGPDQRVKMKVLDRLEAEYGAGVYTQENVMMAVTHSHSGAGGYSQYLFYNLINKGPVEQSFNAMVDGIFRAIKNAHENLEPVRLYFAKGNLDGASINRSPTSYQLNLDKDDYAIGDRDITMKQLMIFSDSSGNPTGLINWFPVHATSMNITYRLMDGDSKGLASQLMEKAMNPIGTQSGKGPFVAAYADSNSGDVTPGTEGAKCSNDGLACDALTSTCSGLGICASSGPGDDCYESTEIIANMHVTKSMELLTDTNLHTELLSGVASTLEFINMAARDVVIDNVTHTTCPAALGPSFLSGATNGPGMREVPQGVAAGDDPLWGLFVSVIDAASPGLADCQSPKPPILPIGEMTIPYDWGPEIVDTQLLKIGDLVIVGLPGEFTTMAGRRMEKVIRDAYTASGNSNIEIALSGMSGIYTSYITTREEYQAQRYEAASTLFGQYTLEAYLDQYEKLANSLITGTPISSSLLPPDLTDEQIFTYTKWPKWYMTEDDNRPEKPPGFCKSSFVDQIGEEPGYWGPSQNWPYWNVWYPAVPIYQMKQFSRGSTVKARFVAGHLRNNWVQPYDFQVDSFLHVERSTGSGTYTVVATDNDWETKMEWRYVNTVDYESEVKVFWDIPTNAPLGIYRISHEGYWRWYNLLLTPSPYYYEHYYGSCGEFEVVA